MELTMNDAVVQGVIAAIVQAADTGDLHGFRLEVRNSSGDIDTYLSDTTMVRANHDPSPMSLNTAIRLIEGAGLRVLQPAKLEAVTA